MYRLLLIAGLVLLFYYLVRRAFREIRGSVGVANNQRREGTADQMIQDPVYRVFIPRGNAIREEIGGQTYFFCSRDCAQAFQKQLSG